MTELSSQPLSGDLAEPLTQILQHIGELTTYHGLVHRVVESQTFAATTTLVDDHHEQQLLEQLLDDVKPPYRIDSQQRHYLIATPFRYPPLKYGSRFGDRTLPSFFYASEVGHTALAECAYYRFIFMAAMDPPYQGTIRNEFTLFSVKVSSTATADLTQISDPILLQLLTDRQNYTFTQSLGKILRQQHSAKVLRYYCARVEQAINIAIADPSEISSTAPEQSVNWLCHTTPEIISFTTRDQQPISFTRASFAVNSTLPMPS